MRSSSRALQNCDFGFEGHDGRGWSSLHAYSKLKAYKLLIRENAEQARHILLDDCNCKMSTDMLLTTISRTISTKNISLARFLCKKYSLARYYMVVKNGTLLHKNAEQFIGEFDRSKLGMCKSQLDQAKASFEAA
eukprot:4222803-Karenia_brevis.AAC.1